MFNRISGCFIATVPAVVVMAHVTYMQHVTYLRSLIIVIMYLAYRSRYHYRIKGNRLWICTCLYTHHDSTMLIYIQPTYYQ